MKRPAKTRSAKGAQARREAIRTHREGVTTVVVDNNREYRRLLKRSLGKHFELTKRSGPEPSVEIADKPCSECRQLMRVHLQPDYKCPITVIDGQGLFLAERAMA